MLVRLLRKNFSFRCHRDAKTNDRDPDHVYAVNRISCHPTGIFVTAGADGALPSPSPRCTRGVPTHQARPTVGPRMACMCVFLFVWADPS
jgi:hypothetical protein